MIERLAIRNTLVRFLQEDTTAATEGITEATDFRDGLGLDSVDFVGLVMRVEGHYHIRLSREELESLTNVASLLDLIQCKQSEREPLAA